MVIIFDLDGTILDNHQEQPGLMAAKDIDWTIHKFPTKGVGIRHDVVGKMERWKRRGARICIMTARFITHWDSTIEVLKNNELLLGRDFDDLVMQPVQPYRADYHAKKVMMDEYPFRGRVALVYEDKPSVVRMWRELGYDVIDVGSGVEF